MRWPTSLQARLGLSLGLVLTVLWLAAATVTAVIVRDELDEVFDSALRETAQRVLPLAVTDIVGREDQGVTQRLAPMREHDEYFTYVVRDAEGRILLQSHAADPAVFPPWDGPGFRQTATHRLYSDAALQGTIRISVAEPLAHRASVAREIQMGLGLPLLVVLPLALAAIILAVRFSLAPLRRFRTRLDARGARDLSRGARGRPAGGNRPAGSHAERSLDPATRRFRGRAQLRGECGPRAADTASGRHRAGTAAAVGNRRPGGRTACDRHRGDAQAADPPDRAPDAAGARRGRSPDFGNAIRRTLGPAHCRGGLRAARSRPRLRSTYPRPRFCRPSTPTLWESSAGTWWRTRFGMSLPMLKSGFP